MSACLLSCSTTDGPATVDLRVTAGLVATLALSVDDTTLRPYCRYQQVKVSSPTMYATFPTQSTTWPGYSEVCQPLQMGQESLPWCRCKESRSNPPPPPPPHTTPLSLPAKDPRTAAPTQKRILDPARLMTGLKLKPFGQGLALSPPFYATELLGQPGSSTSSPGPEAHLAGS